MKKPRKPRQPHSRRGALTRIIAIAALSAFAGYLLAISLAKGNAPKQVDWEIPHDFRVTDATFLPSALPSGSMTPGNRITILDNGDGIFPPMLAAIAAAQKTINFEAYIFYSDEVGTRFRDAFIERASQGVQVRILLDAVGSPGRQLKSSDVEMMQKAGCRVEFFHPRKPWNLWVVNHRNHRRVMVVDGKVGFTGGVGFATEWAGNADKPEHWRDVQVQIEGPAVRGLQRAFQENWSEVTGEPLVGAEFFPDLPQAGSVSAAVVPSSSLAAASGSERVYAVSVAAAAKEIWIGNSYFVPDDQGTQLLVGAVKRGVDVRVIVPSDEHNDVPATKAAGRAWFGPLLQGGVKIFEYEPTMFHPKTMVVDGIFSTVGSTNLDERSFHLNEEINVWVYDAEFAARMRESFQRDLEKCQEYTLAMWNARPLSKRIGEWLIKPFRSEL